MFDPDPERRITFAEIRGHPLFKQQFLDDN